MHILLLLLLHLQSRFQPGELLTLCSAPSNPHNLKQNSNRSKPSFLKLLSQRNEMTVANLEFCAGLCMINNGRATRLMVSSPSQLVWQQRFSPFRSCRPKIHRYHPFLRHTFGGVIMWNRVRIVIEVPNQPKILADLGKKSGPQMGPESGLTVCLISA